jgi:hypothetical protein
MNKTFVTLLTAAFALTAAGAAMAGTKSPNINKREHRQAERIFNGGANGKLTLREADKLIKGQEHVRKLERDFKSDGRLDPWERGRLQDALDRQSDRIFDKKHN